MGDKDAAVTLDSAWYVALLVGFEACSASCTARALATCPFVCVVAAWELVGGVACAAVLGRRRAGPADAALLPGGRARRRRGARFAALAATAALDGRGVAVPSFVALAATRRVVLASARDLGNAWRGSEGPPAAASSVRVAGPLVRFDRLGPREHLCEHLASTRAALESLGSLAAMAPRPESYGGGFLALVAARGVSVVGVVAESRAGPASDGDVLATDGLTGEARDGDLEAQLGPEAAAWWRGLDGAARVAAARALLLAAAASGLKRELVAHALRALSPTAGALAVAARNVAIALAVVALA
ncbi:hypothetical protein JL722_1143 [Aureococcus anophagefferens]|nr:hypothetical protein JL722_1143 [Aureococcus anophagefferens]